MLDRPLDAELFHAGDEGLRVDVENFGCAFRAADPPARQFQGAKNMVALKFR